jgi:hypothetical protein
MRMCDRDHVRGSGHYDKRGSKRGLQLASYGVRREECLLASKDDRRAGRLLAAQEASVIGLLRA